MNPITEETNTNADSSFEQLREYQYFVNSAEISTAEITRRKVNII